jgi:hypothetical protein
MARIFTVVLTNLLGSATDVAVMVTAPHGGIEDGAVYVVPSSEITGLNDPYWMDWLESQVAVHFAPEAVVSLVNKTAKYAAPPTDTEETGVLANAIVMTGEVMVSVTLLVADGLRVTTAVMVTVLSMGIFAGAV